MTAYDRYEQWGLLPDSPFCVAKTPAHWGMRMYYDDLPGVNFASFYGTPSYFEAFIAHGRFTQRERVLCDSAKKHAWRSPKGMETENIYMKPSSQDRKITDSEWKTLEWIMRIKTKVERLVEIEKGLSKLVGLETYNIQAMEMVEQLLSLEEEGNDHATFSTKYKEFNSDDLGVRMSILLPYAKCLDPNCYVRVVYGNTFIAMIDPSESVFLGFKVGY
jgi:hypothetical protein